MPKDAIKTALSVIERSSKAIIGSVDADGYPNIKAMLKPREHDGVKTFYFTTNTSSMRVAQYRKNPKASIYFFDERFFKGVMLKGKMSVLTDAAAKKRIWRDGDEMYYPKGVADPDYCVLKFSAESGRLYQNFGSEDFNV
ncbi:MAG: pyridoxamine 5'-phosphate oxidase family protein [Candidatus Micrarchaeia archaeon]|jgi:general stress protein 26